MFDGIVIAGPEVNITPKYSKLAQFNITPADFQYQMQTQLEGTVIGSIIENQQMTDIRMVYPNSKNSGINNIAQQSVFLPDGKLKPINELATVEVKPGVAEIKREDLQSMVSITARLDGSDLGTVMKNIQKDIGASVHLPSGYHVVYGGAFAEQKKSFDDLLLILMTASLLVFAVILFLFKDYKISLLILVISLLGISGSRKLLESKNCIFSDNPNYHN